MTIQIPATAHYVSFAHWDSWVPNLQKRMKEQRKSCRDRDDEKGACQADVLEASLCRRNEFQDLFVHRPPLPALPKHIQLGSMGMKLQGSAQQGWPLALGVTFFDPITVSHPPVSPLGRGTGEFAIRVHFPQFKRPRAHEEGHSRP